MHSRYRGPARVVAPAGMGCSATVDPIALFIGRLRVPARRRAGCRPLDPSDICAAGPFEAYRIAGSRAGGQASRRLYVASFGEMY